MEATTHLPHIYYLIFGLVLLAIISFLVVAIIFRVKSKKNDDEPELENNSLINHADYKSDKYDENLFHSLSNEQFSVRIIKSILKRKDRGKDILSFATSLPHEFNEQIKKSLLITISQLIDLDYSEAHEIRLVKSPAANFTDLQDAILKFIFSHLHHEYHWQNEEQVVYISIPSLNTLHFILKIETYRHLRLGRLLNNLPGIERGLNGNEAREYPPHMEKPGNYNFYLIKSEAYDWNEIIPEIKKTLETYFPAGIKLMTHNEE